MAVVHPGLRGKQLEAEQLKAEVQAAQFRAQQLRLRLQALGADASVVPKKIQAGSLVDPQYELRSLYEWLVQAAHLQRQVVFECGNGEGEVQVGGRRVVLHRMVTWQLGESGLKLSVPLELQAEISKMLTDARRRGIDEAELQRLCSTWELLGAEVVSASMGMPEPAIFLVHRQTAQAVVVAKWPAVEFRQPPSFDPQTHFRRLISRSPQNAQPIAGDRVEVEYEGRWFTGTLQSVEGDVVNVKCDVDSPGVITVAPIASVRPARREERRDARHRRARSFS